MPRNLIIGANGTIGRALCQQLQGAGELHTLTRSQTDYSEASLQEYAGRLKTLGRFDTIICCIGTLHNDIVAPEKKLADLTAERLTEYYRVNTVLPALCLRYFSPLLANDSPSRFVFLSAMVGSISDNRLGGWYGYRSSKAALNQIVKTASVEVRRSNKNACLAAIHPGTTRGPLSKPFAANVADHKYYTPEQSAKRIISVTQSLRADQSGAFLNWDGTPIPW
ncbi:SDR family NAD(P)-dependent oxidoreductase [Arenicella xantha]|uniref:NAD(P)-dependent dehydrogenase (Short-subunit alcohol dehydrogenase family) n=1 Tax=Arenicella xantha TaxID=644221 RepID=A0A395JIX4_9GAMM|nr:SDR family NAD(P)-dependent oxidoreductase [Arenicella xantha]RBP48581.1 NAD(P)-dependent dehydrogenase (short-subunit alcohol dehydrogenase family) [Arenicella xantha]